jgi:hypothetical protein
VVAPREQIFPAQPTSTAGGRVIASPFQFFTTGEEHLRIESSCSLTGVRLAVHYRFLPAAGAILANRETHTPNSDRTVRRTDHALGAGALLNLTVVAEAGTPRIGQCFVRVQLIRGLSGATIVMGTLLQGYVTARQDIAWPGSPIESSIAGGGVIRAILGTDPAAGAEILETVPTGARWELLALGVRLVTDATVADRIPLMYVDEPLGAEVLYMSPQAGVIVASQDRRVAWMIGMPHESQLNVNMNTAGLPPGVPLLAGQRIITTTVGLQAGDNYRQPTLHVREWLEVS